jgi:acyl carrier protein
MNRTELLNQVKIIVTPYVTNTELLESLSESSDFLQDLKINSAYLVDIILDIEEKFEITIDQASMEKMFTVGQALDIIIEKVNAR